MKKRVKIFSFAICQAVLLALVGLLLGFVYSFGGLIYDIISTGTISRATIISFLTIIGMPVALGLLGFLLGIVEAILVNFLFRWLGYIHINFEKQESL